MQIGSTHFYIRFDGRVVGDGKSTWQYTLCWTGDPHGMSHIVLELCSSIGEGDIVGASPDPWSFGDPQGHDGGDPQGKINGIKWNYDLFNGQAGSVQLSFTLASVFPVGTDTVKAHFQAGSENAHDGHANLDGPRCAPSPAVLPAVFPPTGGGRAPGNGSLIALLLAAVGLILLAGTGVLTRRVRGPDGSGPEAG